MSRHLKGPNLLSDSEASPIKVNEGPSLSLLPGLKAAKKKTEGENRGVALAID